MKNGVQHDGRHFDDKVCTFVCDAPARAFLLGIKGHTGYSCYGKCQVNGNYVKGRVSLQGMQPPPRTDDDFRTKRDLKHTTDDTPLVNLPIHMVEQFPYVYMYLVCLVL